MQDALKTYLAMANGLTEVSRKRAKAAAKKLVKQGGATVEQVQALTEDLLSTSSANRESLTTLVRYEVDRALGLVGLATVEEVENLTARIHDLEAQLRNARHDVATGGAAAEDEAPREARVAAAEARAEAAAVKKAAPRKTVRKTTAATRALPESAESADGVTVTADGAATAQSAPAKKVAKKAATKAPAKRAPAKKVATKAPAKKAPSPQAIATTPATREVEAQVAEVKAAKVAKLPATNPATATSESGGTEL
jgi:polyhydroxyalkanoate synthesis regulator phasin